MSHSIPMCLCPTCGYKRSRVTCPYDSKSKPRPGDFAICLKCGEILVFDKDIRTRIAELNDMMSLLPPEDKMIVEIQKNIRKERLLG